LPDARPDRANSARLPCHGRTSASAWRFRNLAHPWAPPLLDVYL